MQTLLCGGRYKILECVRNLDGVEVYICNDVYEKHIYNPYILNVYSNKYHIKRYLPIIYDMDSSLYTDFIEINIGPDSVTTIFRYHTGEGLEEFLSKVKSDDFETRSAYAKLFLKECILFKLLPDAVANMVMKKENIRVSPNNNKLKFNYILIPVIENKTIIELSIEILKEMFPKNRFLPEIMLDYLKDFEERKFEDIAEAFSVYKEVLPQALLRYEELSNESIIKFWKRIFIKYIKRKFRRRKG